MQLLPNEMRAVVCGPTPKSSTMAALVDTVIPLPKGGDHDLLVEVQAVSVNPCDLKLRQSTSFSEPGRVLGHDAAAVVRWVGAQATGFVPGDAVWYAGNIARQGTNGQFHLVDARLAALRPGNLSVAEAAAMPLTTLTAWEALFEAMRIDRADRAGAVLLILGATGGVGSIAIQLAARLSGAMVVATAGSERGAAWCRDLGAHHVLSHHDDLPAQFREAGLSGADHVLALAGVDHHWGALVELIRPHGEIAMVDDPQRANLLEMKPKSVSVHLEGVFARPRFALKDMSQHGAILQRTSRLMERGVLRSTMGRHGGQICATDLERAHQLVASGGTPGKIVLEGFADR